MLTVVIIDHHIKRCVHVCWEEEGESIPERIREKEGGAMMPMLLSTKMHGLEACDECQRCLQNDTTVQEDKLGIFS